jgi:hypothetical protein
VVVSLACDSNGMDYGSYDCISEHFIIYNSDQAGVAFTGNTRSGWAYIGYPEELSGKLDKEWWRGLFSYDKYILGETLVWSKHYFSTGWPDTDVKQHCEWTFNLLGEPAMPIWTDTPEILTVTHDLTINVGSQDFNVHVEDGSGNIQGATVCLWKDDEVYEVGTTNSGGDATFSISPTTEGVMYVTVTKHNYLPHSGETEVTMSIPGDCDGDGDVDHSDLGILLSAWGKCEGDEGYIPEADFDGSGCIDHPDLGILLANWGYGT